MKATTVIQQYLEHVLEASAEYHEDEGYFSTYYVKENKDIYLQFMSYCVNVLYPFEEEPSSKLDKLGVPYEGLTVSSWEKEIYLTLDFEDNLQQVSRFVVEYFKKAFDIDIDGDTFLYEDYEDIPVADEDDNDSYNLLD